MIQINDIKLYHILHIDRLDSVLHDKALFCDSIIKNGSIAGSMIGIPEIKERRLRMIVHPMLANLHVGDCVPFYFCSRSVMLYLIYRRNNTYLPYKDGQEPILHLVIRLQDIINWAELKQQRWAFTDSNAGSKFFESYTKVEDLNNLDWDAIHSTMWKDVREHKQAEFLLEGQCPVSLVCEIGAFSHLYKERAIDILHRNRTNIPVNVHADWYY